MSYSYLREKRFLYGTHGGYFTGVGAGSVSLRSKRDSYMIESRFLVNNDQDTSEEEWRQLYDSGILIEKAVELVRQGYRNPKPMYEYSPDSPSPRSYDVPYGTILIPNPSPPRDKEGKRIRDTGCEVPFHSTKSVISTNVDDGPSARKLRKKEKTKVFSKSLQSLMDIDESPLERPTIRSRIASQMSKEEPKSDSELKPSNRKEDIKPIVRETDLLTDGVDKTTTPSVDVLNRTKSLTARTKPTTLSTTHTDTANISSDDMFDTSRSNRTSSTSSVYTNRERYKTRSERLKELATSVNEHSNDKPSDSSKVFRSESVFSEKGDNKEKDSSVERHEDSDEQSDKVRRPSFMMRLKSQPSQRPHSTYEYIKTDDSLQENVDLQKQTTDRYSSCRKSLIYTNAELIRMSNRSLKDTNEIDSEKTPNSGSSKGPEYNPETLVPLKQRLKNKMSETSTSTEDDDGGHLVPTNTPLIQRASHFVTQDQLPKSTEKDDSLKSRFLRRFRLGSEEKKEEKKETKGRRSRKRSESSQGDRKEKEKEKGEGRILPYEEGRPSMYDSYSTRGMRLSVDHRMASIDINMETLYKTGTSLAEILAKEEEKVGVDMSKYHSFSPKVKQKIKDHGDIKSPPRYDRQKSTDSSITDKRSYSIREGNRDTSEPIKVEVIDKDDTCSRSSKQLRKGGEEEDKETIDANTHSMSPRRSHKKEKEVQKTTDDSSQPTSPRTSRKGEKEEHRSPRKSRKKVKKDEKETEDTDIQSQKSPRRSRKKEKDEQKVSRYDNKCVMSIRDRDIHKHHLKEPKSEFQRDDIPSPKGILRRIHQTYSFDKDRKSGDSARTESEDSTTSESEGPCNKTEQFQRLKMFCHKTTPHVYEDEIKPILKSENIHLDFRSPRASIYEGVIEEISTLTMVDKELDDDFFNVLLHREVSEESLHILGTGEEEESTRINNVFEKMSQLSFDSYYPSASSDVSLTDFTSSEHSLRDDDSTSSGAEINEYTRATNTCIDDLNEHNTNITNDSESRHTSSESMFTRLERANDELYSGVLNLAKSVKDTEDSDDTVQYSSDDDTNGHKIRSTSNHEEHVMPTVIIENHDDSIVMNFVDSHVCTETVEQPECLLNKTCQGIGDTPSQGIIKGNPEMKLKDTHEHRNIEKDFESDIPSETILFQGKKQLECNIIITATKTKGIEENHSDGKDDSSANCVLDNGLEASPFKLQRMEKKKLVTTAEVNKSIDKAVEETTKDVNNMLHKCNSIDEINNDIQRSHNDIHGNEQSCQPKSPDSNTPKNKLGSQSVDIDAGGSTNMPTDGVHLRKRDTPKNVPPSEKRLSLVEKRLSLLQGHPSQEKDLKNESNGINSDVPKPNSVVEISDTVGEKVTLSDSKEEKVEVKNTPVVENGHEKIITLKKGVTPEKTKILKTNYKQNLWKNKIDKSNIKTYKSFEKEMPSICNKHVLKTLSPAQSLANIGDAHGIDNLENKDEKHITNNLKKEGGTHSTSFLTKNDETHTNNSIANKNEPRNNSSLANGEKMHDSAIANKNDNCKYNNLNSIKDVTCSESRNDHKQMSMNEEKNRKKEKVNEIRSSGSADTKSLQGIRIILNGITTEEATSPSVNVDDVGEKKPIVDQSRSPATSKSLVDIKTRLSEIKARREQLKFLEVNKQSPTDKNDTLIVTEIADI